MPEIFVPNKDCAAGWLRGRVWFAFVPALLGMMAGAALAQVSEAVLHNFDIGGKGGENPATGVFRD